MDKNKQTMEVKMFLVDCPFNTPVLYLGFVDLDCMITMDGFRLNANVLFPFLPENLEYDKKFCQCLTDFKLKKKKKSQFSRMTSLNCINIPTSFFYVI